jgi:hypothetical protein
MSPQQAVTATPGAPLFARRLRVVHNPPVVGGTKAGPGALPRRLQPVAPPVRGAHASTAPLQVLSRRLRAVPPVHRENDRMIRSVSTMATDYDAPRKTDDDLSEDSIEELKARRVDKTTGAVDEDEIEAAEGFELPGADLSNEELSVRVLPRQADEFTCTSCFLVHHRSQLASEKNGQPICKECAA